MDYKVLMEGNGQISSVVIPDVTKVIKGKSMIAFIQSDGNMILTLKQGVIAYWPWEESETAKANPPGATLEDVFNQLDEFIQNYDSAPKGGENFE